MGFAPSDMRVESAAFSHHTRIPEKYTGEGEDVSPPLVWTDPPEGAKSFAVLCHDPDAPLVKAGAYGFVHWLMYDIPGAVTRLGEGEGERYTNGTNDFGKQAYGGPMPPEGHGTHHYYFWVLALDQEKLDLRPGLTLGELLERVEPHLIGMSRLVATYRRG